MKRGSSGLNLLIGVDKPAGMSSHDVVNHIRRALGERRVGHAGTLDPAATGVLVVGVGQGTRLMGMLAAETKSYLASISFGCETNTDDAEGEVTRTVEVGASVRDAAFAQRTLESFVGSHLQVPPAFSAISVDGRRSYARARAGEEVELEPRPITVLDACLVSIDDACGVRWQCAFTVSKGTYIRALARDVGRAVGSAAHLSQLCRTASGAVTLAQCVSLEKVAQLGAQGISDVCLDPARLLDLPVRRVIGRELEAVAAGRSIFSDMPELRERDRVSLVDGHRLMGVWELRGSRLQTVANFTQGIMGVSS